MPTPTTLYALAPSRPPVAEQPRRRRVLVAEDDGDMRRLVRQYGRSAGNVFPSGPYFKGGSYGGDVNFPIPIEEDNNPNTATLQSGCLNRSA